MDTKVLRILVIEFIGTFGLVLFSSGLVCLNLLTTTETQTAASPLSQHQPGIVGIALGQGLILAALLALTAPITGGYLNPALTVMNWVFRRVETPRAVGLIVAQFLGGIAAALCLNLVFEGNFMQFARFGAPHMNPLAYPAAGPMRAYIGVGIELVLTFFLVFAIFGLAGVDVMKTDVLRMGIVAGMIATACTLFGFPLTGAALNPARWLGPTMVEAFHSGRSSWNDSLVYLAGPTLGALAGGYFVFRVYAPAEKK